MQVLSPLTLFYTRKPLHWRWRRQDFFRGGGGRTPRPLKGYHAPPAGGPGSGSPRTVAKFHFLKRFKVLENESIFTNSNMFSYQKSIFSKKNFEKWTNFTRISEFLWKIIYMLWSFLEEPSKFREIREEFYCLVEKRIKKLKNGSDIEGLLEMGWKFLNIWRKSTGICRKTKDHQH